MHNEHIIDANWKDCIYRQREELARMLREPIALLARQCVPAWGDRHQLNHVLLQGFSGIPYCCYLYVVNNQRVQLSDNITERGLVPGHFQRDRADRPYMKEAIPPWGFLLSDAYVSLIAHRPSLTALQVVVTDNGAQLGYLGADFDLRKLPATSGLYREPGVWRQIKGDPAIRGALFQQTRTESPMDRNIDNAMAIMEELLTERGIFQCQMHFSSSQITVWSAADPFRYRILDQEVLMDPDICLVYPQQPYPADAEVPAGEIDRILTEFRELRLIDSNIYLRTASLNIFNGMVSLTFSCDGTHYMRYEEFLNKGISFWSGIAA
jgi:hypothetical protein